MARRWLLVGALLLCCVWCVRAVEPPPDYTAYGNGVDPGWPSDPILQFRPPFPRSLPVQILLTGIVLTLSSVLLIQLVFTAQYHWALAPVNFVLQISAVITLLVTSIVTINIVFTAVTEESRTWPYMLNYVAVDIPPSPDTNWPTANLAAWLLMTATTSVLIQITHIQFLTLLFPSKLERRLIYILLGPLAITAAVMQILRIRKDSKLLEAASAVQNICNATLSLLFTASLFIWGLLVNRKNAWRMDGGTAAFGLGALVLAPMSTAIAFLYVPTREQYTWMPSLMWAIILWQSFLGWWWWVGAGMGVGEVDELLRREEKRKMKRDMRIARRRLQRERAETLWKGVTGALGFGKQSDDEATTAATVAAGRPGRPLHMHRTSTTTSSLSSCSRGRAFWRIIGCPPGRQVYGWFLHWRHEHLTATREQAVQRAERINQAFGGSEPGVRMGRAGSLVGWGLGSFSFRRERSREEGRDDATIVASESDRDVEVDVEKAGAERKMGDAREKVRAVVEEEEEEKEREGALRVRRRSARRKDVRRDDSRRLQEGQHSAPEHASGLNWWWWWGPLRRWRLQDTTEY
ncbi:uncharacterized protein LAESUDRAFT_731137 [Laetiporus sulphureus 93-53]|uniref:PalH-domain-containing protein n=1 Tax=Laetiporus sulphureus 93-53 TaxID=1314785 RepID=A0A165BPU9_9APHY|nr:uncharacterized protein LAESUDRAFT_731137 [Laetiporus sulphureus 93-53]KZT01437.1 hypothetical protein LAESUDRAFT_731137 [Laetiporus sulphureus 93-53]